MYVSCGAKFLSASLGSQWDDSSSSSVPGASIRPSSRVVVVRHVTTSLNYPRLRCSDKPARWQFRRFHVFGILTLEGVPRPSDSVAGCNAPDSRFVQASSQAHEHKREVRTPSWTPRCARRRCSGFIRSFHEGSPRDDERLKTYAPICRSRKQTWLHLAEAPKQPTPRRRNCTAHAVNRHFGAASGLGAYGRPTYTDFPELR